MALETEKLSKEDFMIKMGMLTWILTIQIMEIRNNIQKYLIDMTGTALVEV